MSKATPVDRSASQQSASDNAPRDGALPPDLLAQLTRTLWLPHDMAETERDARLAAASAMLADIDPADGIECMLACQMVATHEAAMACLGRSTAPDQSPGQTDQDLRHAERLMALYTRQVDMLGRHRIRVVEHREQLDRERQNQERQAWLKSMEGPPGLAVASLLSHLTASDPDRDNTAVDAADDAAVDGAVDGAGHGYPGDIYIGGAAARRRCGQEEGDRRRDGRHDRDPAEP